MEYEVKYPFIQYESLCKYVIAGLHEVHPKLKSLSISIHQDCIEETFRGNHIEENVESDIGDESEEDVQDLSEDENFSLNSIDLNDFLKDILLPLFASQTMNTNVKKKDFSLKIMCPTYCNFEGPHVDPNEFRELMGALKENVLSDKLFLELDLESIMIMQMEDQDRLRITLNQNSDESEESIKSTLKIVSETLTCAHKWMDIQGMLHEWQGEFFAGLNFSKCERLDIMDSFLNNWTFFDIVSKCPDNLKYIEIMNPRGQNIYALLTNIFDSTVDIDLVISEVYEHPDCEHHFQNFRYKFCKNIIDAKIHDQQSVEISFPEGRKKIIKKKGEKECKIISTGYLFN